MPSLGRSAFAGLIAVYLAAPAAASAQSGGTQAPGDVRVTSLRCLPTPAAPCAGPRHAVVGAQLRIAGDELQASRAVLFRGRAGRADDVVARARHVRPRHFEVTVPSSAKTGRVDVVVTGTGKITAVHRLVVRAAAAAEEPAADVFFAGDDRRPTFSFDAEASGDVGIEVVREDDGSVVRTLRWSAQAGANVVAWDGLTDAGPAPVGRYLMRLADGARASTSAPAVPFSLYDHVFPIRGRHDLGQSATNNFGGARRHKGQDMFARCGTPIVAARGGKVRYAGYHGQAGNYVVITSPETKRDYVYMHMRSAPLVGTGDAVTTRQPLGAVGDSGNASGCHLHFELWAAPGWYNGGKTINPLPSLRAWDGWS